MYISRCIAKTIFLDLLKQLTIRVKGRAASWLARSGSVAPHQQVLSSILIRSEFPAVGVKKIPRCARREAWPSRAWARVRGFSLPG